MERTQEKYSGTQIMEPNIWNKDALQFVKEVTESQGFWCMDMELKYLDIRIDTRSGDFIIKDRDGNLISKERVLEAIQKWKERNKKKTWRVHYTEFERGWGSRPGGFKDFDSLESAQKEFKEFNELNTCETVPDWYMVAHEPKEI